MPKRPRSHWGDDERGARHREQRQLEQLGDAAPVRADDEITSPYELICREPSGPEAELAAQIAARLDIDPKSPLAEQLAKVTLRANEVKAEGLRARRESANQLLEVAGTKGPPIDRLDKLERKVRVLWAALGVAGTLAGGSAATVAKGLYQRGSEDGALQIRIDHLERDNERLRIEIRDLSRAHRRRTNGSAIPTTPSFGLVLPPPLAQEIPL